MNRAVIILLLTLLFSFQGAVSQTIRYEEEFPLSFAAAHDYVSSHGVMTCTMRNNGVKPGLAWSIVFPEMLRFDAIREFFEVSALKTLYIQYGASYSDFSIGRFQMKPSFAMHLQKKWMKIQSGLFPVPIILFDTTDTQESRKKIVNMLDSESGQLTYLLLFIKIMDLKKWTFKNDDEKIALYAAAYNSSFDYSRSTLTRLSQEKNFFTGMTRELSASVYSYSDMALYYWRQYGYRL